METETEIDRNVDMEMEMEMEMQIKFDEESVSSRRFLESFLRRCDLGLTSMREREERTKKGEEKGKEKKREKGNRLRWVRAVYYTMIPCGVCMYVLGGFKERKHSAGGWEIAVEIERFLIF